MNEAGQSLHSHANLFFLEIAESADALLATPQLLLYRLLMGNSRLLAVLRRSAIPINAYV